MLTDILKNSDNNFYVSSAILLETKRFCLRSNNLFKYHDWDVSSNIFSESRCQDYKLLNEKWLDKNKIKKWRFFDRTPHSMCRIGDRNEISTFVIMFELMINLRIFTNLKMSTNFNIFTNLILFHQIGKFHQFDSFLQFGNF